MSRNKNQLELQVSLGRSRHFDKVMADLHRAAEIAAQREYQLKVERKFRDCPGFIGASMPGGERATGWVIIHGDRIAESVAWLKRRFHVNPAVELDEAANGIRIEIQARAKVSTSADGQRIKPVFGRREQFCLPLFIEREPK